MTMFPVYNLLCDILQQDEAEVRAQSQLSTDSEEGAAGVVAGAAGALGGAGGAAVVPAHHQVATVHIMCILNKIQ